MSEPRTYECGCEYDPDDERCDMHGQPLRPREFGVGWIYPSTHRFPVLYQEKLRFTDQEPVKVRLVEVIE